MQYFFVQLLQIFKIIIIQYIINIATFVSIMQKMFCIVHFETANLQNIMSPLQSFSRYETVTTLLEAIACRSYLPFLASLNNILFESLFLPPVKELFHLKGYRRKESSLLTQMPYFRNKLKAQKIYIHELSSIFHYMKHSLFHQNMLDNIVELYLFYTILIVILLHGIEIC